jgi:enamine deaminase RidA (YjgF/YER057c/UK114 family)
MHFPQASADPPQISRRRQEGMSWVAVISPGISEFHLTAIPGKSESPSELINRAAELVKSWDATIVRQIVFGSVKESAATTATLRRALKDPALPVTWVEGAACDGSLIAGLQLHAIAGAPVRSLTDGGLVLGRVWRDTVATHCVLGGLEPPQTKASRPEQARAVLEGFQASLALAGMGMKDVARTWLFLDDLLSWYGDFNRVRSDFFARTELRPGAYPASTGVSGRNPAGAALTAAAWAVRAIDPEVKPFCIVPSPQQCPAPAYGSSFSRAVEVQSAGFRQLLVSGTASIAPDGKTAHAGDVQAQIELTMRVAGAILESRRMSYADVSRATAYFKSPGDAPVFQAWLARHGLETMPVAGACCAVCRDDLLFEIELDAIQAGN